MPRVHRPGRESRLVSPSFWRDAAAASSVEFAIVASVFILLVFAVVQLGTVAYRRNMAAEGARFGARWAMVRSTTSGRAASSTSVQTAVRAATGENRLNVSVSYLQAGGGTGGSNAPGNRVEVTVSYPDTIALTRMFPRLGTTSTSQSPVVF